MKEWKITLRAEIEKKMFESEAAALSQGQVTVGTQQLLQWL